MGVEWFITILTLAHSHFNQENIQHHTLWQMQRNQSRDLAVEDLHTKPYKVKQTYLIAGSYGLIGILSKSPKTYYSRDDFD